jgi:hypothetical protein
MPVYEYGLRVLWISPDIGEAVIWWTCVERIMFQNAFDVAAGSPGLEREKTKLIPCRI